MLKNYYKMMLGPRSLYVGECQQGNFIGADYGISQDLIPDLSDDWKEFSQKLIQVYLSKNPEKTRIAAGLAAGALWTVSKVMQIGDIVLCPNGKLQFLVGEVTSDYSYLPNEILPHRRSVRWLPVIIDRLDVSLDLRSATKALGTVSQITRCAQEIESYINGTQNTRLLTVEETEDLAVFGLEKYLEEFLVDNWSSTELGKSFDIYQEEGESVGQQYETDTGNIDILAISKDKKELLVVELKRGRASDRVVGQIQRYMGFIKAERAEPNQVVKGAIIALEDDKRIRRTLSVTSNIEFYKYQITFKLQKNS